MDEEGKIPLLYTFYFGEKARQVQKSAGVRLKKWSRAFDRWLEECEGSKREDTAKHARQAWKRLLGQCTKMPWEMAGEDIREHARWMVDMGYSQNTTNSALMNINAFFGWCAEQHIDSACPTGFNPAEGVSRIRHRLYQGTEVWSQDEVQRLLELVGGDLSTLGRRDHAFFLLRLHSGARLSQLLQLRWGQVEQEEDEAWVRWRPEAAPLRLPEGVWRATREWLEASGRLGGMEAEKFIFAPLAVPSLEWDRTEAGEWLEHKALSAQAMLSSLKLYGGQVGIAGNKLSLAALRRTAIRNKMEEGESVEGMQAFMDTAENPKQTRYRLRRLLEVEGDSSLGGREQGAGVEVPVRRVKNYKPGDNVTHGFYSQQKDPEALKAMMAEDKGGLVEEIGCLRELMRGMLEREVGGEELLGVYSLCAERLNQLIRMATQAKEDGNDSNMDEVLAMLDRFETSEGRPPVSETIIRMAREYAEEEGDLPMRVNEQVATVRLLLRRTYARAGKDIHTGEYVRLVDLYSQGCMRLARLVKQCGSENERVGEFLRRSFHEGARQMLEQAGWEVEGGT